MVDVAGFFYGLFGIVLIFGVIPYVIERWSVARYYEKLDRKKASEQSDREIAKH